MSGLLGGLERLDAAAFVALNGWHRPVLDALVPLLSQKLLAVVPAALLAIVLLRLRGRRAWLLLATALLAVGVADLSSGILKGLLGRVRPCHVLASARLLARCTASYSLPSNHAVNMAALAGVAWTGSRVLGGAFLLLAAGVAYSRVYLGVHYPGDVLAGLVLGAALGWALGRAALALLARLRRAPAAAPQDRPGQTSGK